MSRSISGLTRDQRTAISRGITAMADARERMDTALEKTALVHHNPNDRMKCWSLRQASIRLGLLASRIRSPNMFARAAE